MVLIKQTLNFGSKRAMASANENMVFTTTYQLKIGDKTLPAEKPWTTT